MAASSALVELAPNGAQLERDTIVPLLLNSGSATVLVLLGEPALGMLRPVARRALPELRQFLQDPHHGVRWQAGVAIRQIEGSAAGESGSARIGPTSRSISLLPR